LTIRVADLEVGTVGKIKLPETALTTMMDSKTSPKKSKDLANFELGHNERATLWAAFLNTLAAAVFVGTFIFGLGLMVGVHLAHRVARWIKGRVQEYRAKGRSA
jgi:ABC-type sugar transport system permease subunit